MNPNQSIQAIPYILSDKVLFFFTNVAAGWNLSISNVFRFIRVLVGYQQLGLNQDQKIADASKLLKIAAILGIIASLLDLIPMVGTIASVLFIVVLVIEIIGLLKFKGATAIGRTGKGGINLILFGIFFSIISSLLGFVPFIGESVASFFALSILHNFYGWVRVQSGMIQG